MENLWVGFLMFIVVVILLVAVSGGSSSFRRQRGDYNSYSQQGQGYTFPPQQYTPQGNYHTPGERLLSAFAIVGIITIVVIMFILGLSIGVSAGPGW